ncbi:clathrin interactor EPSIN 2-like [Mercurialis annua]|uniref:clathrin interactor EPSIN 2-like n=1 Tax=Mercurialis annua TaxID=3986 RepID=UPI00215F900A|nr:clathrin interactor EPSIN 2-like [Mercurialis annua]
MKKVFDQTFRDIKREVNKKVLKVPGVEQKVLDATSNEPWGPHGSLLADIAQATRNYHEYQMIMAVIWKRLNDTGKNWRHVYKGLTVLEYLVAHGSERVIDEIREHAYQISTLSDFQYIDSSGRDQGSNVRKKSQSLVVLVNDKERIIEVRQKAASNREKFRNTSAGGMYRPGSNVDRYDDDRSEGRYGSKDEDRNGYGREREYSYKDEDRNGRYGDSYSRDGDRYGRDSEDRYSRDSYRDDEYRGRSRSIDDYGSRGRSSDRGFDDDGQSSRGSGAKADDQSQDGSIAKRLERKFSEQNIVPPSYEEAVNESRSPAHNERTGETSAASVPGVSPLPPPRAVSPAASSNPSQAAAALGTSASSLSQEVGMADEFDPRGPGSAAFATTVAPAPAVSTASNNAEMDLLGSLSDSFAENPLAIMPVQYASTSEVDPQTNFPGSTFAATQPASNAMNQSFEDPFGDSPFKAIPSANDTMSAQTQTSTSGAVFQPTLSQSAEIPSTVPNDFGFGNTLSGLTYSTPNVQPTPTNSQFMPQELSTSHDETDILADILPPTGPSLAVAAHTGFPALAGQPEPGSSVYGNYNVQAGSGAPVAPHMGPHASQFGSGNFLPHTAPFSSHMAPQTPAGPGTQFNNGNQVVSSAQAPQFQSGNFIPTHGSVTAPNPQFNNGSFLPQPGSTALVVSQNAQHSAPTPNPHFNNGNFMPQPGFAAPVSQVGYQNPVGYATQPSNDMLGNLYSQGPKTSMASQPGIPSSSGSLAVVPQPSKEKFETKSTVWADTLSRGLVNLNISGSKINPLSDIGIDFDAINRKEKRMEKPTAAPATSTINMGKAMGSGSGVGRAGASVLRAPPNPMMNPGMGMGGGMNMGMGMGGGPVSGMAMGAYGGGMNQPMGMNMGMNMGMGMGQGGQMPPPGSTAPGGYNPMMGTGGYTQQPYGGGYR